MGKVIAISSEKGGVTKTSTTANLAVQLSRLGFRVLAGDYDPQAHLCKGFGYSRETYKGKTIKEVILSRGEIAIQEAIVHTFIDKETQKIVSENIAQKAIERGHEFYKGPDLIPIRFDATNLDTKIYNEYGGLETEWKWHLVLRKVVEPIKDQYDFILIDNKPGLGYTTVNAYVAADYLIIPVTPETNGIEGVQGALQTIADIRGHFDNPHLRIAGILMNKMQPHIKTDMDAITMVEEVIQKAKAKNGDALNITIPLLKNMGLRSTEYEKALRDRSLVTLRYPNGKCALSYWQILKELLQNMDVPVPKKLQNLIDALQEDLQPVK